MKAFYQKDGVWNFRKAVKGGKDPELCQVLYCKNKNTKTLGIDRGLICNRCRSFRYRLNNPEKYAYDMLRKSAKSRGIEFTLTFEHFVEVTSKTAYMRRKGQTKVGLTIDRKDNTQGYVNGNIQVLTRSQNSKKRHLDPPYIPPVGLPF